MAHFSEEHREKFLRMVEAMPPNGIELTILDDFGGPAALGEYDDCTDILPEHYCQLLGIPQGSTYGFAAINIYQWAEAGYQGKEKQEKKQAELKDRFLYYLDQIYREGSKPAWPEEYNEGNMANLAFIIGRLWECDDPFPDEYSQVLGLPESPTFSDAAFLVAGNEFSGEIYEVDF